MRAQFIFTDSEPAAPKSAIDSERLDVNYLDLLDELMKYIALLAQFTCIREAEREQPQLPKQSAVAAQMKVMIDLLHIVFIPNQLQEIEETFKQLESTTHGSQASGKVD